MSTAPVRLRLGEWLIGRGMITTDQLQIALLEQKRCGHLLGKILTAQGFISEAILRDALAAQMGQQGIDLSQIVPESAALQLLSRSVARRLMAFPLALSQDKHSLILAMTDPNNLAVRDQLRQQLPQALVLDTRIATEADIAQAIDRHYGSELSIDSLLHEIETGESGKHAPMPEPSQPVVRLIDALLADAVACGASDIHLEPEQGFVRIRYRLDGVLQQIRVLHRAYWPAMVVRLKVMSGMNIAESRAPQDGRITQLIGGRLIDFRVSIQPTLWGENLVLRILDRQRGLVPLAGLGLAPSSLDRLHLMISRPEGILLVTGPTGAGKTTTLYSILSHIDSPGINIMTLEDPVEYPLPRIRQTSINDTVKMDFVSGIRSMMRQDPDVILVGEIRDRETAEMALRAAMTGHQVYATLHTHSALGALPRLQDLGIAPDMLAGNIIGVIAQRLLRKLCPHCRESYRPDARECRLLNRAAGTDLRLHRARGCTRCHHSGYSGRMAVMELLHMNPELDDLLARRACAREIREAALAAGLRPLADEACDRVLQGDTSLEEIVRITDLTGRLR